MIHIRRSTVIDAPIEVVWEVLRDFNSHEAWHPAIAASRIEGGRASDEVGCVRDFALKAGGGLREQLLALSDRDYTLSYCIIDSPVPLVGYVATIRLRPITDGNRTFWSWESRFEAPPGREAELTALVARDIYEAGFGAVRAILRHGRTSTPVKNATQTPLHSAPASRDIMRCKAIVVEAYGGPEQLRFQQVDVLPPGPGKVRLQHTAIGVNFIDIHCRTGYFNLLKLPGIPGMEAAGIVLDVGEGVTHLSPGDRVAYACSPVGAYSEIRTMAADLLVPLPADIADETAAAILLKGMTAELLLHRVHKVQEGQVVLIHAAAGGVGQLLCQWARALGATVIGTVGSANKTEAARVSGAMHTIIYGKEDFAARVREITSGHGADVIYDAVGRETFIKSFEALAFCGHLVSFGQASGPVPPVDISTYSSKSATISRPNFDHYTDTPAKVRLITDNLFRNIRSATLRVPVPQRFPLGNAAEAHRALEGRRTTGSLVLIP